MYFFKENGLCKNLIAFMLVSIALLVTVNVLMPTVLSSFKFTHFLFNYESEFLKRGFIGEVFRLLGFEMNYQLASTVSYVLFVVFTLVFLFIITSAFKDSLVTTGVWLFIFMAAIHPATIQHFYVDLGRFDAFAFLIAALSIYLIARFSTVTSFVLVPILIILMLLIHEGTFFMYVPLILGFWLYRSSKLKEYLAITIVALISIFSTYVISKNGLITNMTKEQHYSSLVKTHGEDRIGMSSVAVLHGRELKENFFHTLTRGFNKNRLQEHVKLFIILFPLFLLMLVLLIEEVKSNGFSKKLLFIATAFGPLGLYPLGHDHFRWWALALTNLFVVLSIISYYDQSFKRILVSMFYKHQTLVVVILVSSVVVGGMGVTSAFQRL